MLVLGNVAIEMQKVVYCKFEKGKIYFFMKDGSCIDVEGSDENWKTIIDQLSYFDDKKNEIFVGYQIQNYAIYLSDIDCVRKAGNSVLISFDGNQQDLALKCEDADKAFGDLILFYNKNLSTGLERK